MAHLKVPAFVFSFLLFSFITWGQDFSDTTLARQYLDSVEVLGSRGDRALAYGVKALEIYQQQLGEQDTLTARAYFLIAEALRSKNGEKIEIIEYYKKALAVQLAVLGEEHVSVANTYDRLASVYTLSGEKDNGAKYRKLAFDIYKKNLKEDDPRLLSAYDGLALAHRIKKEYDKALEYSFEVLAIRLKSIGENHLDVSSNYLSIGLMYQYKEEYDKAIKYYQKIVEILHTFLGDNHQERMGSAYYSLALVYKKKSDYDKAIGYLQKIQIIKKELYGEESTSVNSNYSDLGELYYLKKDYKKAIEIYEKALAKLEKDRMLNISIDPGSRRVKNYPFSLLITHDLLVKSNYTWMEGAKTDPEYFDLKKAFTYSEKAKAIQLLEGMQHIQAKSYSEIPDSLLQLDLDLRDSIAHLETTKKEKFDEGFNQTPDAILSTSIKLKKLYGQHDTLIKHFEKEFPKYYKAKYGGATISVEEVQNELLKPGQSLVEYFYGHGDSSIYIFLIQKSNYEIFGVRKDTAFSDWVGQLNKDGIYGYYTLSANQRTRKQQESSIQNYTKAALKLYELLWLPIKDKLTKEVIIIPHGILGYVPFEALLTKPPPRLSAFVAYPFLLYDHQISYCASATLLREMQQKQHRQNPPEWLLAMAPFFQGDKKSLISRIDSTDLFALRDTLAALPASGEEVAAIGKMMEGTSSFGTEANLGQFKELAEEYRILHLSTHGKADKNKGDFAYLAFGVPNESGTFDKLYARELYNYTLNADMVVLSACETAVGVYIGEIISLSRAFTYAGAKSIFTTLWQVSDEKTKDIFIAFYKYLKKGKSKDEALRLAKLDYLKVNAGKGQGTHPFFWAGLIGIGDMSPLVD